MDVNKNKHLLGKDIEGKVNVNESELERYKVILGDVFFTRTSEVLEEIGLASVILENVDSCVYSGFVIRGRNITNKINPIFSGYLYNTENVRKEIIRKSSKTTRALPNSKSLSEVIVHYPSLSEQQKIGNFFFCIDKKLELQQERIDILKEYKKGMMQRIFSQEIRFKDENGENYPDWGEKLLGEIINYKNGLSNEKNVRDNGRYFLITLNSIDINGKLKNEHTTVDDADWLLKKHDIVMVLSDLAHGDFLGLTALIPETNRYVLNQRMGLLRVISGDNKIFINEYINYNQIYFKKHGQGSSQLNLRKNDILHFKINLPSLPEQEKIAEFLSAIDKKIELEEERLEEYEKFKKGLMQRMFV